MPFFLTLFFIICLLTTNTLFIFQLFFIKLQTQVLFFVLFSLTLIQLFLLYSAQNFESQKATASSINYKQPLNELITNNGFETYKIEKNTETLKIELEKINTMLVKQPTHRDLLINQAILNYHLGEKNFFHTKLNEAIAVDPNHKLLKTIRGK